MPLENCRSKEGSKIKLAIPSLSCLVELTVFNISVSIYHCLLVSSCYLGEKAQKKQKMHFYPF